MTLTLAMQKGIYRKTLQFRYWGSLLRDSGIIEPEELDSNLSLMFRLGRITGEEAQTTRWKIPAEAVIDILRENLAPQGTEIPREPELVDPFLEHDGK